MTTVDVRPSAITTPEPSSARPGLMARLGTWTATYLRAVLLAWAVAIVAFGFFAPKVQTVLAGVGVLPHASFSH